MADNSPFQGFPRTILAVRLLRPTIYSYSVMLVVDAVCMIEWAVEGLTEGISKEVKPEWNIHFQVVEPGAFRTEWGNTVELGALHDPKIYDVDPAKHIDEFHEACRGDPEKAGRVM